MTVSVRPYAPNFDFARVGNFLIRPYHGDVDSPFVNWLQPRWEYMHFHPLVKGVDLAPIGIWEADGLIVAGVHPELTPGLVYFQVDPAFGRLRSSVVVVAACRGVGRPRAPLGLS